MAPNHLRTDVGTGRLFRFPPLIPFPVGKLLLVGILVPVYRQNFDFSVRATEKPWSWSFLRD